MSSVARVVSASARRDSAGSQALLRQVYRVLNLLRIGLAVHALAVNLQRGAAAAHPGVLVGAMIVLVAWTGIVGLVHSRPSGRTAWWSVADVAVALLLVATSEWILGSPLYERDYLSVPVFWSVCGPLAVSVGHSVRLGVIAALGVGVTKIVVTPTVEPGLWSTLIILVFVAGGVGILVEFLLASLTERDRAFAETAALAERERLNRIVHDGVLQLLTLMEREGPGLGPRGARLAELAREQEARLRVLLQDRTVEVSRNADQEARRDLTSVLDKHASSTVTISAMADEVPVDLDVANEVDAVVTEILANVRRHAGPTAQAWLLLEREGNEIIVSIRDNGVGATPEQLTTAGERGHLGVRDSVIGRVRDLGGQATVRAAAGRGVEWELRIPVA